MKATAPSIPAADSDEKGKFALYAELSKARLTSLVLFTTFVGFYAGSPRELNYLLLLNTLLGTALVASGAAALNQLLERDHDANMLRTADRPLPSGRLTPEAALIFGGVCAGAGLIYLAVGVNLLTSLLGISTLLCYLFIYTPLKRRTTLNTTIGAISGALPPLMGWTAAQNKVSIEGWSLFAILFFWQLPHFLAIAWMYREDYAKAGFAMLPVVDPSGVRTGRQAVSHTLGLLPVSLMPFLFQMAGFAYLVGALILGLAFIWFAVQFSRKLTLTSGRRLFYASIIYLPLLLGLMVLGKIR